MAARVIRVSTLWLVLAGWVALDFIIAPLSSREHFADKIVDDCMIAIFLAGTHLFSFRPPTLPREDEG